MKLKRVKIFGFKTFADRTDVELDGNIIAIIGPNGCGKSNIVDAILWGLGETNARNLRAQTAKEIIFSGSSRRKSVGFAEVSLLFDNEDGALPIDTSEVAINRRLNRAGDSDYAINKRSCRLRDVNDLLADSGLGRAGYAIVTQSDIDQALSASAQQRRAWIDEAAGVQRYRTRRVESMRRLEAAQSHLARVHDIIHEIELQREPLREEAETARQYKTTLNSLREIESSLLGQELAEAIAELEDLEKRIVATMAEMDRDAERVESLRLQHRQTVEHVSQIESKLDHARTELTENQSKLDQALGQVQLGEQKLESLTVLQQTLSEEGQNSGDQIREAQADLERDRALAESARQAQVELQTALGTVDSEAKILAAELKKIEQDLLAARKQQVEFERSQVEAQHAKSQLKALRKELAGIAEALPELESAVTENEAQLADAQAQVDSLKSDRKTLDDRLRQIQHQEENQATIIRKQLAHIAALDGRRRGIAATIEANEGLAQGSRAVMDAVKSGRLEPVYTPVARAISTPEEIVAAIETALGASSNDLIVPQESDAKTAIAYLKEHRAGRATFQPIPLMRPSAPNHELNQVLNQRGVVGRASDLVDCHSNHRPVIESLLGRTVIVETIDIALKLAKTRGWNRLVTLDGELVHASGAVTGGTQQNRGNGLVQRKAELDKLEVELEKLQLDLVALQSQDFDQAKSEIDAQKQSNRDQLNAAQTNLDEVRTWVMSLRHELTTTKAEQSKRQAEADRLSRESARTIDPIDVATIEQQRDLLVSQLATKSSDAESAQSRMTEARQRSAEAAERLSNAERRLSAMTSNASQRATRFAQIEPERARILAQIAESNAESTRRTAALVSLRETVLTLTEQRTQYAQTIESLAHSIEQAQKSNFSGSEVLHQCELKRARADSRRSNAAERLLEEYGMRPEEAIAIAAEALIAPDAAALVTKLRRDLKAMGDVNLGAIEAFERLTERHDELAHQVADVEEGMGEIQTTIKELDAMTRERFVETFEKLQVAFADVFVRLLGGGEAKISLSDPENMLDSGVEIAVTIPGKKQQRLELLSGGERAMSALAFLFSLLQVKPCPLVILDEVDAPLDGRNVERFIKMMRDFNDRTQFILITHNNVTIESADVFLGVTMQEPGVSTVIPFRVPSALPSEPSAPLLA
jgi:chromosome segregation protein